MDKCTHNMTYHTQQSATNSAMGFGGQGLKVFYCEIHNGWHWARDKTYKRKPCPRCGEHQDMFHKCYCYRDAMQQVDPWSKAHLPTEGE